MWCGCGWGGWECDRDCDHSCKYDRGPELADYMRSGTVSLGCTCIDFDGHDTWDKYSLFGK